MNDKQFNTLMEALALVVEAKGMEADNAQRIANDASPSYDECCFYAIAEQIRELKND